MAKPLTLIFADRDNRRRAGSLRWLSISRVQITALESRDFPQLAQVVNVNPSLPHRK
jgi:hypothetical protein